MLGVLMQYSRLIGLVALLWGLCSQAWSAEIVSLLRSDRTSIRVSVYKPLDCRGTVVVSHGAGGSESGYRFLGEGLSKAGWLVLIPGHQESGQRALRENMREQDSFKAGLAELVRDSAAYNARLSDIDAARQWGVEHCRVKSTALVGHSMGAATTMLEAGALNNLGIKGSDRFDVYVAMSPQGVGPLFPQDAWKNIHKPLLSMTGTRDKSLDGDWTLRLDPFKSMLGPCKWQAVIDGATHMNFAGIGLSGRVEDLTMDVVTVFLDRAMKQDCQGPPPSFGNKVTLEIK